MGQAAMIQHLPAMFERAGGDGETADRDDDAKVQDQRAAHLGDDEDLKQAEDDKGGRKMRADALGKACALPLNGLIVEKCRQSPDPLADRVTRVS